MKNWRTVVELSNLFNLCKLVTDDHILLVSYHIISSLIVFYAAFLLEDRLPPGGEKGSEFLHSRNRSDTTLQRAVRNE